MAKVETSDIQPDVEDVLRNKVAWYKNLSEKGFVTAYQIFQRLPPVLQQRLEQEYGQKGGSGAGVPFSAATRVAQVAAAIDGIQVQWIDTGGLAFDVGNPEDVGAGYRICAVFRLP
jgi:hypothetical protein